MKLAEALIQRSDLSKSIDDLETRISTNAVIQEGNKPNEDPDELLKELHLKLHRQEKLLVNINTTNLTVKTEKGTILAEAISRRDTLSRQYGILNVAFNYSSRTTERYSRTEIANVPTMNASDIKVQLDKLTEQKRLIEAEIQAANWANDLIESK